MQRFDATNVADLTALQKAITDATDNADLAVTLTGNIEVSGLDISKLTSLTITPGSYSISGTFTGVKNLTIGSSNVTNTEGVNVAVSNNNVNSITGLSSGAVSYAYNNGTAHTDTYTINASNLMVSGGTVYGVNASTNVLDLPGTALFNLVGVNTDTGLTYTAATGTIAVTADALTSKTDNISINTIAGTATATFNYDTPAATPASYSWTVNGKNAYYRRADYFAKDSAGTTLVYHAQADNNEVVLDFDTAITATELGYIDVNLTGNNAGTIDVKNEALANGFTITSGNYTINDPTTATTPVGAFTLSAATTPITVNGTTATIKGKWSAGYYLEDNKTLKYVNQQDNYTVATVTGLKNGVADTDLSFDVSTGKITLNKAALTNTTVDIVQGTKPNGTTNNYKLKLSTGAGTAVPTSTVGEENKWSVSGNTATYSTVKPEYWTLDTTNKQVTYTAQKDVSTLGKISGIVASAPADAKTGSTATFGVNAEGTAVVVNYTDTDSQEASATVISTTDEDAPFTFNVAKNALPTTTATVSLSNTSNANTKLALDADATAQSVEYNATAGSESPKWTFTADSTIGTATLTAKLTNGYTLATGGQSINCAASEASATLVTITGLDKDIAAKWDTEPYGTYYTIEGYDSTATKGDANNIAGADTAADTDKTITITLKKAALTTGNVAISSTNDSYKYVLALDADAKAYAENLGNTTQNDKNVWRVNSTGTVAYYQKITPSYYTVENGSIKYHAESVKGTYATITGLKDLAVNEAGELCQKVTSGDPAITTFTEAVKIDGNTIILNNLVLNDTSVRLTNGTVDSAKSNYSLAMDTTGSMVLTTGGNTTYAVAQSDIDAIWWEVADGTATLHESTATGYSVENNGLMLKYSTGVEKTLATVTGLSSNVKLWDKDGTEVTADSIAAETTAEDKLAKKKSAIILGTGTAADKVAHQTGTYANNKYTWTTGANQAITLTDAMLNSTRVTLRDNQLADANTFKLVLAAEGSGGPKTSAATVIEWQTDTNTAQLVQYKNAYYTASGNNLINYTKATTPVSLLELSGLATMPTVTIEGKTIKKDSAEYITVDDDHQTVNVDAAVPTTPDSAVKLTAKGTYANYTLDSTGASTLTDAKWEKGFATDTGNTVTYSQKVKDDGDKGLEFSSDGKTVTRRAKGDTETLFTINGLKTTAELTTALDTDKGGTIAGTEWDNGIEYDSDTKTVTLKKPVLSTTSDNITLTTPATSTEKYKLALDPTVPQKASVGFSWAVTTVAGRDTAPDGTTTLNPQKDRATVVGKKATMEYFTKVNDTTIRHNAEATISTLFTITGLDATAITADGGNTDKDGNYIFGANVFTVDEAGKTVTLNEGALPSGASDGDTITIDNGWKLAAVREPVFPTTGTWTVANGTATLSFTATTAGYLRSSDGRTLTYVGTTTPHEFLTISGLATTDSTDSTKIDEFNTALAEKLANAFDAGTKTVTLPKDVLAASDISIESLPFTGDTYKLALASDVLTTKQQGYAWKIADNADDTKKDVTFNPVYQEYYSPVTRNGVTSYTYHAEAPRGSSLFTLTGLNPTDDNTLATIKDKDGNASLDKDAVTSLISVDFATSEVTLNSSVLPNGKGENDKQVEISGKYKLADNFKAPEYSTPTWGALNADSESTLTFVASQDGYKLSSDKKTLTYVAQSDTNSVAIPHEFLTITGLKALPDAYAYDEATKTVTLPDTVLAHSDAAGYVSLISKNNDTYTLALDTELYPVRTSAQSGYAWTATADTGVTSTDTLVAKAVTMDWYRARGTNNYEYQAQRENEELFTITGLAQSGIPTTISDVNGDNTLTNGTTDYLSFSTSTKKVTILNKGALPTGNGNTISISSRDGYTFDTTMSDFETPMYNSSDIGWTVTNGAATLTIKPKKAGYEISNGNKTLTYFASDTSQSLMTLSGLASSGIDEAKLKAGVEVDLDNKTLTLSRSVLTGSGSTIAVNAGNDYKLVLESDIPKTPSVGLSWSVDPAGGTITGTKANMEYFVLNSDSNSIAHTAETARAQLFTITGLNTTAVTSATAADDNDGNTTFGENLFTVDEGTKTVTINEGALPSDADDLSEIKISAGWKLAAIAEPEFNNPGTWDLTNIGTGSATLKFTASKAGYFLSSADSQTLKYVSDNTAQEFLTITGLATDTTAADLANAFDAGTKTVTLPKDVLAENAVSITTKDFISFTGDTYELELASDVLKTPSTPGYGWEITDGDVNFYNTAQAYYYATGRTNGKVTTFTFNDEQRRGPALFKLTGLDATELAAFATTPDKDGNTNLDKDELTKLISVATDTKFVTLDSSILPIGNDENGNKVQITGGTYQLSDTFTAPVYSDPSWTLDSDSATLKFKASQDGYKLSNDKKTLTYVGQKEGAADIEHAFLTISGLGSAPETYAYDEATKTVTLPDTVLAHSDGYVRLFSENSDTYTLALDTDVRTATKLGYAWFATAETGATTNTLVAKSVNMDYYESRGTNNYFYHPQATTTTLFTITGLVKDNVPDNIDDTDRVNDIDGDKILGNNLIEFDATNHKVTILNKNVLPTTNGGTISISSTGNQYSFDTENSAFGTPTYNNNNAVWTPDNEHKTATLSIKASRAGYAVSDEGKTLTYVDASTANNLMTLSGLAGTLDATALKKGIDVDVDAKTLTLSESVLKGTTRVIADSGYTLALDSEVSTDAGTAAVATWVVDSGVAYYRNAFHEYYTLGGNSTYVDYHAPQKDGDDLFTISGLAAGVAVNANGDIAEIAINAPTETGGTTSIRVSTAAIADTNLTLTTRGNYKFTLADNEATIQMHSYEYDGDEGTVTVKATFTAGDFIVSADGKTITKITDANKDMTLAEITGLNADDDTTNFDDLFTFDTYNKTITFNDESLIKGTEGVEISSDEFGFKLALDSSINTDTTVQKNKWAVNDDGNLEYKQFTLAHYTLTDGTSISYTPDVAVAGSTAAATISGLKSGLTWAEGTTAGSFSIFDADGNPIKDDDGNVIGEDAVSISGTTIILKKAALPTEDDMGEDDETATITLTSSSHTLALDPADGTIPTTSEQSNFKWNQEADATTATITAKTGESYVLDTTTGSERLLTRKSPSRLKARLLLLRLAALQNSTEMH